MTDEEKLAEEYVNGIPIFAEEGEGFSRTQMQQAYLAGLKTGKEIEREYVKNKAFTSMKEQGLFPFGKWHKVADGDLPPCENGHYSINVLTDSGDIAYYDYNDDYWTEEPASVEIDPPIAWCKIPKFEENE